MAFDFFAISAMLSKCEQSFSKASYTISTCQSNFSNNIIESEEESRLWVSAGVVNLSAPSSNLLDMT